MLEGTRVGGRYKILMQIGGGGMSHVYLAHDVILNRDVAIKVLRYDFSNEDELQRRFQREALSATSLLHPNIVAVYDVGEDADMHYIVMEYIEGKTLKKYIQEFAPLSPARTLQIMKQLVSAIAHAHENGIIHRDIKPQNVLMNDEGNVKVTDFGIATTLNATSLTQTNSVMGTVHYLSPEQARGGLATKRSDIYALGIVMYELLTGELPFSGESAVSIALKHLQAETPSVRDFDATIPQSVENIVLKATSKDPLQRYTDAEEMLADLTTALTPSRMNEPKFSPLLDDDATKAMPIIKDRAPIMDEIAQTKVIPLIDEVEQSSVQAEASNVKKQKKKRKKWPVILAVIVALIAVAVVLVAILTPNKIEIPDVADMSIEEAEEVLVEAGFKIGEQIDQNSEDVEEGFVIKTNPKAGLSRVKGTEIALVVSVGHEAINMPNYVGRTENQVLPLIEQQQFEGYEIVEKHADAEVGTIIEQHPAADSEVVAKKTKVVLTVSKGKELVAVTNLSGFTENALNEYAKSSGFNIKISNTIHSETIPVGSVVKQSPEAGSKLAKGGTITVNLSKGPEEKAVKTHIKNVLIPYTPLQVEGQEPQLTPQVVKIYIEDQDHSLVDVYEEITITGDTNYRVKLVIAEGEKAAYQIVKEGTVIASESISYNQLP